MTRDLKSCPNCHGEICAGRVPIFSTLDMEDLAKLAGLIIHRPYAKGELIAIEGSDLEGLIIINKGQVKAYRITREGKEQILYVFSEGDFVGEKNLLKDQKATYNIEALEETNICMIKKNDFKQLISDYPDIGFKIMEELFNRLDRLENAIKSMGTQNVEARINSVLLEFADKYGKDHPKGRLVILPLSREGIANYIGVARETVSRKLTFLQDAGVIELRGNKKLIIIDKEALKQSVE